MIEVDALLFDLDGTLIDSKKDLTQAVRWLQARYQAPLSSEDQVSSFIGDGVMQLVRRALPRLSARMLPEAVEIYKSYYRIHCLDTTRFYPGVVETIHAFRHKKMAVVTNKPLRVTRRMLESLGLLRFFSCVLGGDSLRRKKPFPDPILRALHEFRVFPPKRAVMVGDGPNDIQAGAAAGTYTCAVLSNISDPQKLLKTHPQFVINNLSILRHLFH